MDSFLEAVQNGTRNPDTFAYLAEASRRQGLVGEGALFAKRALELNPRHSMAHTVLASCFDDQLSPWPLTSIDSTRTHSLQAVACDSTDGNAWMGLVARRWIQPDLSRRSLAKLLETGFLTEHVQAYGRWMLHDLPESTVLITNGDLDTYPAWALQAIRGLRPDIAVLNYQMIRLAWYLRRARDDMRVPLPFPDQALDSLGSAENAAQLNQRILHEWQSARASGGFRRPLAVAISVPAQDLPPGLLDRAALIGGAYLCGAQSSAVLVDTTTIRKGLALVRPEEFAGPGVSDRDWSPIRRNASPLSENVLKTWLLYVDALGSAGRTNDARKAFAQASDFARKTTVTPALMIEVSKLKARYGP